MEVIAWILFGADYYGPRARTSFSDRDFCGTDRLGRLAYLTRTPSHPKAFHLVFVKRQKYFVP